MRVLVDVSAVPAQPVGAGVYTTELVRALDARVRDAAHDVSLVLLARRDDRARWTALAPRAEILAVVPGARPVRVAWEQTRGAAVATRHGIDVWHGPHYTMPTRLAIPAVVTIHDLTFFDTPETHERAKVAWFRRAIRTSARDAAALVCVSALTASRLDALVPGHAPVSVIHHGVDHERFTTRGDVASDLARLALHGIAPPYVAFVGTVEPRKNLPALVHAFAALAPGRPDLRLVLAGNDGWGRDELRHAITEARVATRVVRPGYVDDETVAALHRRADAVAYPSLAEGFGLPALEALACGAPLVTAAGTAMDEVVDDAAIRVDPRNADELRDGLAAAFDPSTAVRLRERGPRVAARFTWDACAAHHIETYRAAVSQHAGVAAR